jgi:predicted nucleotidyltransferase
MLKNTPPRFSSYKSDWLFAVSDYFRKDGIRATLRYVPDENGERELNGIRYKKYDFGPAFEFMRKNTGLTGFRTFMFFRNPK